MNLELIERFFGFKVDYVDYKDIQEAELLAIGSILGWGLPPSLNMNFANLEILKKPLKIWGSGFLNQPLKTTLNPTKFSREIEIYALRGKKTRAILEETLGQDLSHVVLADPGILAEKLINKTQIQKIYDIGIIPHHSEINLESFRQLQKAIPNSILIDVHHSCMENLEKIAQCNCILSSAMHGLIIADGMQIPNLRLIATKTMAIGQNWKFEDYYSVYDMPKPFVFDIRKDLDEILKYKDSMKEKIIQEYAVPQDKVEDLKKRLIEVFPYKHCNSYATLQAKIYKNNLLRKISELDKNLMLNISSLKEEISKLNRESKSILLELQKSLERIHNKKPIGAVKRIRNHLNYKLGSVICFNSKNILGLLILPFILFYVYKIHEFHQKTNPKEKLKLKDYEDHKEALTIQEGLYYKVGEAFVRSHKQWYKGGYLWFWVYYWQLKKERYYEN
nr:polysaccharide pyruvyl transferase family protein [Helicobacter colisuis]